MQIELSLYSSEYQVKFLIFVHQVLKVQVFQIQLYCFQILDSLRLTYYEIELSIQYQVVFDCQIYVQNQQCFLFAQLQQKYKLMSQKINKLIQTEVLNNINIRIELLEALKVKLQNSKSLINRAKEQINNNVQKLPLKQVQKQKLMLTIKYLEKRINLKQNPYLQVVDEIIKLKLITNVYKNISTNITYEHISKLKELNSIYIDIKLRSKDNNVYEKTQIFYENFQTDLNECVNNFEIKKIIEQIVQKQTDLFNKFQMQILNQ